MDSSNVQPISWLWLTAAQAAEFAAASDKTTETLRKSQGLLTHSEFVRLLATSELEIIIMKNKCAALVTWGQTPEGLMLNVLTMTGTLEDWETGLPTLECAARDNGAKVMAGVGHPGWKRLMKRKGFETYPRLYMRKVLS